MSIRRKTQSQSIDHKYMYYKHVKLKTEKVQRCASMISTEHDEMKSRETVRHHSGLCYNTNTTDEPCMWESLHEYVISIKKCSV